jgi:hypothetical protein
MRATTFNIAAAVAIGVLLSLSVEAQEGVCDLRLKVYSYDLVDQAKARLQNVSVRLRGKGIDEKITVGVGSDASGFKGLKERSYELEFSKPGYRPRSKRIDLDCLLRDGDAVWNYTYLWRDKKVAADDTDLVEDPNDDSAKAPNTAGIGRDEIAKGADEKVFGKVTVQVLIDVDGNVLSASRVSGESKLAERAILMARKAKFSPTIMSGEAVQVSGKLTYNFVP